MVEVRDESSLVRLAGISKSYRGRNAVEDVSFTVRRGEIFGIIGPDGAGKSTLMKTIAGVLACERGEVEVFDVRLDSERAAERIKDRIGFMPQGLGVSLYPELSVEENMAFFASLRGIRGRQYDERKAKLLAMTRLDRFPRRPMKHLSGGMKQKLALACTLIHEPQLIILDEATTGVDPVSRRDFWTILAELLRDRGVTAIVSTAYLDEAERFHRLVFMYEGRVLAVGEPEELRAEVRRRVVEVVGTPQVTILSASGFPR